MLSRLAILALLPAVCACDPRPPTTDAGPPAAPPGEPRVALSNAQARERSEECGRTSREVFQREWKEAAAGAAPGQPAVDFTNHYNAKLDTCFYLLTVNDAASGLRKMLFDVNEREPYGEYLGREAAFPATCRVEHLYCASSGEWDVLVSPYMED